MNYPTIKPKRVRKRKTERRFYNLVGQKFTKLTVIEKITYKEGGKHNTWKCLCDCGNITFKDTYELTSGRKKSCGCGRLGTNNPKWSGYNEISGNFYTKIKNGANVRNIVFDISVEYIWDLFLQQNRKCFLSGVEIKFGETTKERNSGGTTASLDRVNSKQGYMIGNVQWIHKNVNRMKWDLDQNDFIYFCSLVTNKITDTTPLYELRIQKHGINDKYTGNISGFYKGTIIRGALSRNLEFSLDWDVIWNKYIEQYGRCTYTGIPIEFAKTFKDNSSTTASLDRIDNSKGYINDNVHWVHKNINSMKLDMSEHEFKKWCKLVTEHNERQQCMKLS